MAPSSQCASIVAREGTGNHPPFVTRLNKNAHVGSKLPPTVPATVGSKLPPTVLAPRALPRSLREVQFLQSDVGLQQPPITRLAELEVGVDDAGDHVDKLQVGAVAAVDRSSFQQRVSADAEP